MNDIPWPRALASQIGFTMIGLLAIVMPACRTSPGLSSPPSPVAMTSPEVMVDVDDHPRLDRWERVIETPARWFRRAHTTPRDEISLATLDRVESFLAERGVRDITIVVNSYDPAAHWKRLWSNTESGLVRKSTLGVAMWLNQSILPARVLDRNFYDPLTRTLAINTDEPSEILAEAAFAVRVERSRSSATQLALAELPLTNWIHRVFAAADLIEFARSEEDWALEQAAYRLYYGQLGRASVFAIIPIVPVYAAPLLALGSRLTGEACAAARIWSRSREREQSLDSAGFVQHFKVSTPGSSHEAKSRSTIRAVSHQTESHPESHRRSERSFRNHPHSPRSAANDETPGDLRSSTAEPRQREPGGPLASPESANDDTNCDWAQ